ncbi:hypothetical protein FEDK69T_29990 [Flavobacterium enshiense DK69]|nr:hypothetical protein [Flavobacterium enshiense]ESU20476.1 hypothetical protein FEDK69T_29990 [Flavobacterium enshiense DK69]
MSSWAENPIYIQYVAVSVNTVKTNKPKMIYRQTTIHDKSYNIRA